MSVVKYQVHVLLSWVGHREVWFLIFPKQTVKNILGKVIFFFNCKIEMLAPTLYCGWWTMFLPKEPCADFPAGEEFW